MLMIGMAALFLAGFLLLTVFGAQSFRSTAFGRGGNMDSRALSAYLVTAAKSGDHERAITVRRDAAAGDVLVLADGESGYALHVFCADGMLMEDYAPIDAPLSSERAQRIAATQRITFSYTSFFICFPRFQNPLSPRRQTKKGLDFWRRI